MEFNRDILSVIHEFSLPRMRFVNEFAAVQREIREKKVTVPKDLLRLVKEKLSGPNADYVFQCFMVFVESERVIRSMPHNKLSKKVLTHHGDAREYLWNAVLQRNVENISFDDFRVVLASIAETPFNSDEL